MPASAEPRFWAYVNELVRQSQRKPADEQLYMLFFRVLTERGEI